MEILLYLSAAIAALSLLLIAIFVIITLKSAKQTMDEVSQTIKRVETKVNGITEQSEVLMQKTTSIATDAEKKLHSLDTLTLSAEHIGQSANHMNDSFEEMSKKISNPPEKYVDLMQKSTIITEIAARMYYRIQREKEKR